jgi:hypothetical protein
MKILSAVLTLVALLACVAFSAAREERVREGLAERVQDLNLTDDQEAKIAEIRKEGETKVAEARKELAGVVK